MTTEQRLRILLGLHAGVDVDTLLDDAIERRYGRPVLGTLIAELTKETNA